MVAYFAQEAEEQRKASGRGGGPSTGARTPGPTHVTKFTRAPQTK